LYNEQFSNERMIVTMRYNISNDPNYEEKVGGLYLNIRQEEASDYTEVYELVKVSFATASH